MRMNFRNALIVSLLAHGLAYGGGLGWAAWRDRAEGMELDLAHSSLMPLPAALKSEQAPHEEEQWVMDSGRRLAPRPPQPVSITAKADEAQPAAYCPPPCPSNAADWAAATSAVRRPEWTEGMIGEADYPAEARAKNQTGKVVVEVLLDAEGHVRDVQMLAGSYQSLNAKTLEKLRAARFTPCMDGNGKPFPCRMRLPIVWTLD
jgi:TonB family protein